MRGEVRSKSESLNQMPRDNIKRFMEYGDADKEKSIDESMPANRTYNKSLFSRFKEVDFIEQ